MSTKSLSETIKDPKAIRRVTYHTAAKVETCEHCGAAIKHVFTAHYRDETSIRLGSTCIEKALSCDKSSKKLFKKNASLLPNVYRWKEVLNMAPEEMPRGSEYYGSGLYFIGDGGSIPAPYGCASKSDIHVERMTDSVALRGKEYVKVRVPARMSGHWLFHPCPDIQRNAESQRYVMDGRPTRDLRRLGLSSWEPNTPENQRKEALYEIEKAKEFVDYEIRRIERVLATSLAKGLLAQDQPAVA